MTARKHSPLPALTVVCAVLALVGVACGSALDRTEIRQANGALQTRGGLGTGGGGTLATGTDAAAGQLATNTEGTATDAGGTVAVGGGTSSGSAGATRSGAGASGGASGATGLIGGGTSGGKKSEILFGTFGVEAGVLGAVTGPAPPAIRAWVNYINAKGGLNGHPVRMIFGDDSGDPARAQAIVRQMVEQDHVISFFTDYEFNLKAVLPYLEQKNIPIVGSIGGDPAGDHSPMAFNPLLGPDVGQAWGFIMNVLTVTTKRKIAAIYCREATTCAVQMNSFKKLLPYKGLSMVYQAQASLAQPDFTAEMLGARNAGAEVILALMDSATVVRMEQSAHRQNYRPLFAGTYNLYQDLIIAGGKEISGLSLNSRSVPWDTSPKLKDYRDAMARYQPNAHVGDLGAGVFIVGSLLEQKIAPFLGEPATTAQILQGLYALHGETLGGLLPGITFNKGEHVNVNHCVVPILFDGAKFHAHDAAESFVCAPDWKPGT